MSLVDPTGMLNLGIIAHAQSAAVQKKVGTMSTSDELSYEALQKTALSEVEKQASAVGNMTSSEALTQLDDEEQNQQEQTLMSRGEQEEEEVFEEEETSKTNSSNPLIGNLLNLKV